MPTSPSRRLFLAAGSAATVFGSLGAAAAARAPTDDPIFAAIAERERLEALHIKAIEATDLANRTGSDDVEIYEGVQFAACSAVCDFERHLFATAPTTVAGAIALLRFIGNNSYVIEGQEVLIADAIRSAVAVLEREALA